MSTKKYKSNINIIIENIMESMQNGKEEIFNITETINKENTLIQSDIAYTKNIISVYTKEIEELKEKELKSRERLLEVSSDFSKYTNEDIKIAYDEALEFQKKLISKKSEITTILQKLEDFEKRVETNNNLVKKADLLLSKLETMSQYIKLDISEDDEEFNDSTVKWIIFQEKEKSRIARDIHDGPAQTIASLVIKSDIIKKLIEKNSPPQTINNEIEQLKMQLRNVIKEIRRIMYDLRPTSLDEIGFVESVEGLISKIKDVKNINFELIDNSNDDIKSSTVKIICFRIMQESLNNIVKHSEAKQAKIDISISSDIIKLTIQDDGVGFDVENVNQSDSFGLSSLKERVTLAQGETKISSSTNKGTTISINIPNKEDVYA